MGILEELTLDETWETFLDYKIEKRHISAKEKKEWSCFIEEKKYKVITAKLLDAGFCFADPQKKIVNKKGTQKKRIVYTYDEEEAMVLKVMSHLLYRYDSKISDSCYSFRRNKSAKSAIHKVLAIPELKKKYCLKADISNYFNSIPADKLCEKIKKIITDDEKLVDFLERLLTTNCAYLGGELIVENRGAMAGTPISPFFANLYLDELDRYYENSNVPYFRYSDDILLVANTKEELEEQVQYLETYLTQVGLTLNPDKVEITNPGEAICFLGVCIQDGNIDLAPITKDKLKAKIKRKTHALYRWRCSKGVDFDKTAKVLIRIFNQKFYEQWDENSFTWSRWFFPMITCDKGLKELDEYFVSYIRYLYSGRHYKGNYRIRYEEIKELGYRSLVHEYYLFHQKKEVDSNKDQECDTRVEEK